MAHRSGTAAIVGRPNVGKSTLLNALVGTKVAIVSAKPQTTRTRVLGIRTRPDAQIVFLDTPGIHAARSLINRRMVETARQALGEADVVVAVVDATAGVTGADRAVLEGLGPLRERTIGVLNKIDRLPRPALLPLLGEMGRLLPGRDVVPVSARDGDNVTRLLDVVVAALPEGPSFYPEDQYTTASQRFMVEELVREQLFIQMGQEIPYGTAVTIDEFREPAEPGGVTVIHATILVERDGHKGIVIGAGGQRLREIGQRAREAIETLLGGRVYLELFVRVEPGWARNPRRLGELGL